LSVQFFIFVKEKIMNKAQLVEAIAKEANTSKKDAEAMLKAYVDIVTKTVKKGDKVQLVGFGTFEQRKRAARKGKNPKTGETIKIPAAKVPVFRAGAAFKAAVNGKKK
jgi:DNA-binding protein HU-beta